jgi:VCBS repeat-containing protein
LLAARRLELELREQAGENAAAARGPALVDVPVSEPERMTPLPRADKALIEPLDAPRPFTVSNDVANATEDGGPVIISVLGNDVGAAAVARINGVAVTPGNIITLQSGARVIVNANGTLSYEVGTAFQSLAAGQTAQDIFTYAATDGGGSPLAPEGVFNAAAINGTNGFVIHGAAAGDRSGYSVAGIGDVNGDGRDDLLISALSADLPGRIDAGVSYVVYGRQGSFGASLDLGTLTAATGFAITGVNAFDFSGASARAAGDVNGDGLADFIIGAPWGEATQGTNAGESYLVFGRQGGFGSGLDLATLNGTNGVTFRGVAAGDGLGFAVSAAGDINGDGFDDLILGAREANGPGEADSGASYVVFGRAGGFTAAIDVAGLTGANGFTIIGTDATDRSGYSVAAAGDVNGDGIDDLIIGAPQGDPGGRANAGEAYVVFGRQGGFGATLDLGTLSGTNGFTISGVDAGDHAGWSVASAGDLNGDGRADMVIGALYADPAGRESAGETYVVFGRAGGFGANLDLSSMPASMGFTVTGTAAANLTGHSVASAGDINGDGIDDLLIGAIYADGTGGVDAGETYVVFGRTTGFGGVLDLASLNGQTGFAIGGLAAGDFSGQSVSAAGDVNSDGFDDLIIGAPMADPSGRADAGSSYVIFGAANITRTSNDATVTVTVTGINDAPVITSNGGGSTGAYTIVENTTGPNTVTAFDPDAGANLTYSISGGADAARFTINSAGVISLINAPDFEAPTDQNGDNVYEVIVQVSDGQLTDTQTIRLTVVNANEAPVITSGGGGPSVAVPGFENSTTATTVVAVDPDAGANLTYSILTGRDGARFMIDPVTGVLTFVTAPDFEAPTDQNGDSVYEVDVQVSDGLGGTDVQTIFVNVGNAPEAPVITSNGGGATGSYTIVEGTLGPNPIIAVDPDIPSILTYSITGGADAALFTINASGVLSLINPPDFEAPADQNDDNIYEVIVQASDGQLTDTQTINLTVTNANEAPVITSGGGGANATVFVAESTGTAATLTAADPDAGAQITWSITGGADSTRFTIDAATGVVSFVALPDFELPLDAGGDNNYDIVVQASDGVNTDTQNLRVTVTDVIEPGPPVLIGLAPSVTFSENAVNAGPQLLDLDVTFTDSDGDFAGGTLSLSGVLAEDRISVRNQGSGAGQIGLSGSSSVTYGGVIIGLLTGGVGTDLTITFNSAATSAAIDALIQNLTYANVSDAPTATRNLVLNVMDAAGTSLDSGPRFTQQTGANNPFDGLSVGGNTVPRPALADLDGDGDLDAVVGQFYGTLSYFENTGTAAAPTFVQRVGTANPFDGVDTGFFSAPFMADMDGDGDLDAILGTGSGTVNYLENTGTEQAPTFVSRSGSANPFNGISLGTDTLPALVDLDGDGDLDAVIGRRDGLLNYFENTGSASTAVFTARTGSANPFNGVDVGTFSHPSFADIDGDGDLDAVVGEYQGTLLYFENTGSVTAPVFVQRTGQANPFDGFNVAFASSPTLGDLDGDGDLDVLVGEDVGPLNYLRNTTVPAPSITITVTGSNDAPVITSAGGSTNGTVFVAEGSRLATTVTAADPDAGAQITWSITGGADAALFAIDAATGVVSFLAPSDFETPLDAGGDNNYDIVVQASDGVSTDSQNLRISVTDVSENTLSLTDVVGGVAMNEGDPFILIDGDVTFTDAGASYDGGLLAITGLLPTDLITINNVGTGSGQISLELGVVSFEGVDIGTIAPSQSVFSVLFNANANRAAIEALVEALQIRSTSDIAVPPHNIVLEIFNGLGQGSAPVIVPIQFTADILNGTADNDILDGLRGNDVISGFDGLDTLSGGEGNDTLFGGNGNDNLDGGVADDTLSGDDGDDTLNGGDGRDRLFGNALNDILNGDASDDFLDGGSGDDTLNGGGEDDRLLGGDGADTLDGGDGHDRLDGGGGSDLLTGGAGHDLLTGGAGVDTMRGGDGDDQLSGGGDNDEIRGEAGIDTAVFKGPFSSYTVQIITAGVVQVTGPDGSDLVFDCEFLQFDDQTVSLSPALNNEPPRITSDGGGIEVAIDINEGQTAVTTVVATDLPPGAVTYSIFGGADAAQFTIDAATGALTFITAPDFEAPTDAGRDNTYDVIVSASDGQFSDLQGITVTVLDIAGAPVRSSKGGGPEICYAPDDAGGDAAPPQVLPGMSDKSDLPPLMDDRADLREARDFFPQESSHALTLPSADPLHQPPIAPWDDGFS